MDEFVELNNVITFLQVIIPIGAAARVAYCLIIASINEEDGPCMKVRARNAILFTIVAEVILTLLNLLKSYF